MFNQINVCPKRGRNEKTSTLLEQKEKNVRTRGRERKKLARGREINLERKRERERDSEREEMESQVGVPKGMTFNPSLQPFFSSLTDDGWRRG